MSQLVFIVVALVAFVIFGVLKLTGFRVRFERIFKALATVVGLLPLLVLSSLIIFVIGFGLLYIAGIHPDIPRQYTVVGIWALTATAIGIAGINWLKYVVHVARDE
jgi:hypothetical protein